MATTKTSVKNPKPAGNGGKVPRNAISRRSRTASSAAEKAAAGTEIAAGMVRKNQNALRALVIGPVMKQDPTTGTPKEIPVEGVAPGDDTQILSPPLDPLVMATLPENSSHLGKCIEAMVVNIAGFGHNLRCFVDVDKENIPPDLKRTVLAEKIALSNFFRNCSPEETFLSLRKRTRRDRETIGWGAWEVVRKPSEPGTIQFLNHIPSHLLRMTRQGRNLIEVEMPIVEAALSGDGQSAIRKLATMKMKRRFRKFCQQSTILVKKIWFKEFGDPRHLNSGTGEFRDAPWPPEVEATEIIYWPLQTSSRTPYGLPRFVGTLLSIFGDRAAEEVNYLTLRNNNIPSMMVLVSNGQLTEGSISRIESFIETQVQGSDNWSRFLLLEAESSDTEGGEAGQMKLDIKPLTKEQMRDEMFGEYGDRNAKKTREAFRLPPVFTGATEEYSRATAQESRKIADEQVFAPERRDFDDWINKFLFPAMGVLYHEYVSNGPNVTNDEDIIRIMANAERSGGMTPRQAVAMVSDILGRELALPQGIKLDVPFSLQMAEAVKNQAAPNEVGQQVTALKSASPALGMWVEGLLGVRTQLEEELNRRWVEDADYEEAES